MLIKKSLTGKKLILVFKLCLFMSLTFIQPFFLYAGESEIIYIRSDIKVVNGLEIENELLMQPATEEFRQTSFKEYSIVGMSSLDAKPDPLSAAKHNAIKSLLRSFGTQSIRNQNVFHNTNTHDESVLSFEGFIKTPYIILSQGLDKDTQSIKIEMDVFFAPLAYPDQWTFHYFKKKLYDTIRNMVSVFR